MDEAREARREAIAHLAGALRRMNEIAVRTGIAADRIEQVAEQVDALAVELAREQHDGPFSGLLPRERDYSRPHHAMPLSPVIGELSPMAPEIELRIEDGRVRGSVQLGKRFIGPPGYAHGGVTAMICDQLVALAARACGVRGVTRTLAVRYRRPTPLYRLLELEAWGHQLEGDSARAVCEIRSEGEVCVRAEAELVVSKPILAQERRSAPPAR